jgi:hypothetical protein
MRVVTPKKVNLPTPAIQDSRRVANGGYSTQFRVRSAPKAIDDSGKVCIGGYRLTF